MRQEIYDINNTSVQMLMVVRMQELQRSGLPTLRYPDLEEYLCKSLWKRRTPKNLNEAANDILHVTANDIVRYMSYQAVIDGASGNLEDFTDLIGGML